MDSNLLRRNEQAKADWSIGEGGCRGHPGGCARKWGRERSSCHTGDPGRLPMAGGVDGPIPFYQQHLLPVRHDPRG